MLLLISTVQDKHIIGTNCTITTQFTLEESENMLWISIHRLSLLPKVHPWWFSSSTSTFRLYQLECSFCCWFRNLIGNSLQHKLVVECLMTINIFEVNLFVQTIFSHFLFRLYSHKIWDNLLKLRLNGPHRFLYRFCTWLAEVYN